MLRYVLCALILVLCQTTAAAANETLPPAGVQRLSRVAEACGSAPRGMFVTAVILAAVALAAVLFAKHGGNDEK